MPTLSAAVIGAGPAGTSAAHQLARLGAHVVMLEARPLPRHKACGGGLTPKAQRLLPDGMPDVSLSRIHRVAIQAGRLPAVVVDDVAAEVAMVQRAEFDLAMAELAAGAGVTVRDDERVTALAEDATGVWLETTRERLRVDVVVAADGDPSRLAPMAGLAGRPRQGSIAIETDLPLSSAVEPDTSVLMLDVRGGYGWYFPKGDHANVGVVCDLRAARRRSRSKPLVQALDSFADRLGLDMSRGELRGHRIPQGLHRGRLATRRIVLAGDAAGTADPMFGEGIAFALFSGQLAARAIADMSDGRARDLSGYEAQVRRSLGPSLRRLGFTAAIARRSPTFAVAALGSSRRLREYAVGCVAGLQHPFQLEPVPIALPSDDAGAAGTRSS